jgi:RNA polymerase sigma factor (sigma-70 family)
VSASDAAAGSFLTTRWSVVRGAAGGDEPRARAALEDLCAAYWKPLYAFARRRGAAREDAADLTQGFFARLLERRDVGGADPARGRFRAYLLGAFKHHLANEAERERALKRGGGVAPLRLDFEAAEVGLALEPADPRTPERAFERDWALAVLARAFARVEADYRERGRGVLFEALRGTLAPGSEPAGWRSIAQGLGQSEGAVKVAAHRLRRAFRAALRAEIAETVEGEEALEAELAHLIEALGA